jgi:hypothetical protein
MPTILSGNAISVECLRLWNSIEYETEVQPWLSKTAGCRHGSNGLLFSAITGQILAAQAAGFQLSVPTDSFLPERFSECPSGID